MPSKLFLLLLFSLLFGCYRPPEFPNVPEIEFEGIHLEENSLESKIDLVLAFKVKDGDGDIGLSSDGDNTDFNFSEDLLSPYHQNSWIIDSEGAVVTFSSTDHVAPFSALPIIKLTEEIPLLRYDAQQEGQVITIGEITSYYRAGEEFPFSESDPRPSGFNCEDYDQVEFFDVVRDSFNIQGQQGLFYNDNIERAFVDSILVDRNPFYSNLFIELEVKVGNDFVPIEEVFSRIEPCDPIYTARFPVFDRSDFGRPVDGIISYSIFSVLWQPDVLAANPEVLDFSLRMRFWIYDRAMNQSNEVITPEFKIIELNRITD